MNLFLAQIPSVDNTGRMHELSVCLCSHCRLEMGWTTTEENHRSGAIHDLGARLQSARRSLSGGSLCVKPGAAAALRGCSCVELDAPSRTRLWMLTALVSPKDPRSENAFLLP
jgi:hypothetical protein